MQKNAKKKNAAEPVYKPYLTGRAFSSVAARRGVRILGLMLLFAFVGVIASGVFSFNNAVLRLFFNGVVLAFCAGVMYTEGSRQGENDVAFAEIALGRQNEGKAVADTDKDICYHRLKGFVTALIGAAPFVLIALLYAFMAVKQQYTLGALPSWVSAYETQDEISQALAYYHESAALTLPDILRVAVRLFLFPYMNMLGNGNYDKLYLLDKLSPLLTLIVPLFYGIGYLRGPHLRALVHGNIRLARRKQNRTQRKAREARAQKMRGKPEQKELI